MSEHHISLDNDPLWYKDGIIYEVHVRSFADSDGDGIGDFNGLTRKLDYLQDLGVTAIWLLPFCPSPLKDDGYDIANFTGIHPAYGMLRDFRKFLREAHKRGLRVITELVVNHTSDQHPWFQRSRKAKLGSKWRDYYVWSDTPDRYPDTRIIFQDFEGSNWTWDPVAQAYYWHRFYSHQPDLNYDHAPVRKAIFKVLDFWFQVGVDGLRLDAVPYLFEREGTNCENLPETHTFLKELRSYVDRKYENRMLLAEANQWPEDASAYFGDGDECHMAFHFPVMPRLFMALQMEDYFPVTDILEQTPAIPENCQWALFLRNHDELTLEMVTDEERDYMYRVYAQNPQMRINQGIRRRLAPLIGNHRRKIELLNAILFSLPGTPVIYYGDEIGMGDNIYLGDRNGVRTPMQWHGGRNAGFSEANPQQLYFPIIIDPEYHYEVVNVEVYQGNPYSLLWWMKRLMALRKQSQAFGRGTLEIMHPENRKILAYLRHHEDECILVVANLSRFSQCVELDLSDHEGERPVEMFGGTEFFPIQKHPYALTLGPHSFFWFRLEPQPAGEVSMKTPEERMGLPLLGSAAKFEDIFKGRIRGRLERLLPEYLQGCRWFAGKAFKIKSVQIVDIVSLSSGASQARWVLIQVDYVEEDPEIYALPLSFMLEKEEIDALSRDHPHAVVARLALKGKEGLICDATFDPKFSAALIDAVVGRRRVTGSRGEVTVKAANGLRKELDREVDDLEPSVIGTEQSNSSVVYGEKYIMKLFRRLDRGVNPDLEIGQFLTRKGFTATPRVAGSIEYLRGRRGDAFTLSILQEYIPNQCDAWTYTQGELTRFYEKLLAQPAERRVEVPPVNSMLKLVDKDPPEETVDLLGSYLETAYFLGARTGELHAALAGATDDREFTPQPFTKLYQRSLYQSMRSQTRQAIRLLRQRWKRLPEAVHTDAEAVLELEPEILKRFAAVHQDKITALRTRCHGDYHLGQVLFTGDDFVIIDFEGEPARPISERRIKCSPLKDVAGMLRSFHYAAYAELFRQEEFGMISAESRPYFESWASLWYVWMSARFLRSYLEQTGEAGFLPSDPENFEIILSSYLLEKALYELAYELNNRPDWVLIPFRGIRQLLED
jgi:maltose alpha-D-glucosyltransferase/alpha-amylase